jgi:NTE family protein
MSFSILRLTSLALIFLVLGCATSIDTRAVNTPRFSVTQMTQAAPPVNVVGEHTIGLSFSGGGLRAAAFAFGVLQSLAQGVQSQPSVLDDVAFISSVSGGSLLAAYYGLHGPQALDSFRNKVLLQDMERTMLMSLLSPSNIVRLLNGGLNDRSNLAALLNRDIFAGATFADMYRRNKPAIWINATDVYNRTPFVFTETVFDALCSDLAAFPVAEAVHASLAVPLVFAPVVLESFPTLCSAPSSTWINRFAAAPNASTVRTAHAVAQAVRNYRNPAVQRYVKLVDGGITDNYGLSSIMIARAAAGTPHAPISAVDAVKIKRMLFIVVDAGRGPSGDWALTPQGPSGVDLGLAATDAAIDSAARISFDAFRAMLQQWQSDVQGFRCALPPAEVVRLKGATDSDQSWDCGDVKFDLALISFSDLEPSRAALLNSMPTRLTLHSQDIDTAIAAGRDAANANPILLSYRQQKYLTNK